MRPLSTGLSSSALELLATLQTHGVLRLNSTPRFPNVIDSGAGWPEIMELVSGHLCFVSLLVEGRTTYLSIPVFEACAALAANRPPARGFDAGVLDLLGGGPMTVEEVCGVLQAGRVAVRQSLFRLQDRFAVTVFGPGRNLNPNWDTYVWCTREDWQRHCPLEIRCPDIETARGRLRGCLSPYMSPIRVSRLIDRLSQ